MRLCIFMVGLFILFNYLQVTAQNKEYYCGWDNTTPDVSSTSSPCFNVDDIMQNCTPVYVRINLHFFVNDNCNGQVQQMDKNQKDVYRIAEEMIHFANATYENNEAQWQVPNPIVPCVPIRLVLKGIYMHCKSDAVGIVNTPELNDEFGVNKTTEINFYIADTDIGASGIGLHEDRCGSATFFNKESWWTIGNFVHELGHILTLRHAFENDGCGDTPKITHDWDKDCDGILESSIYRDLNETNLTCWNKLEPNKHPGEPGYSDINHNTVHDCDEQTPCTESPCCRQEFMDNNVMSYSAAHLALTECQVRKMLTDLSGFNCDLIEKIGGCPPASAFITQTPEDIKDQTRCRECLILEASANDDEYELKIYERINNQELLVYNGGWKTGPALTFCYRTGSAFQGFINYLKPNTNYIAYLKTKNQCSEDNFSYPFTTNSFDCGAVSYESLSVSPNPGFDQVYIAFTPGSINEHLTGIAKDLITGHHYLLIQDHITIIETNHLNLDISHLPSGTYTLLLLGENSIYQNNFIKM